MPSILELRAADQARKNEILLNLYGVSDTNALRAASTKTNDEIVSAIGNGLIDALRVLRPVGTGCFLFSTTRPTSGTITVRSSTGYARIVFSDNTTTGNASGTGSSTSDINLTIPAGTVHRPYAVIATANLTGTTASGNITLVTINSRNIHAINVSGLSACTTLSLRINPLTSFSGTGLGACTYLDLSANQLTSFSGIGLSACTILDLSNNLLTSFNGTGLSACVTLFLSNNRLTSFSGIGLSACTDLNLSNNLLTSFSGTGLGACTYLDLSANQLTSFSGTGLGACVTLFLNYNALTSFNGSSLSSLQTLDLTENSNVLETFTLNVNSFQYGLPSITLIDSVQTTESLNMILSALPPVGLADIYIIGNPGSSTCNTALAPSGWVVVESN